MKRLFRILILVFLGTAPPCAFAWGPVGHETVAYIARDHLTPKAALGVARLLEPGQDMASVSNWADSIVQERPWTADWHHIDLDVRKNLTPADLADYCPRGKCVVGRIEWDIAVLKNPKDSRAAKREALKFLIHFIGDLHQPLHCANDSDRGGNEKFLRLRRSNGQGQGDWVKLHSYWDHLLEVKTLEDPRELASALESRISPGDRAAWERGDAADWAFESYLIAKHDIYSELPAGPLQGWDVPTLPEDYDSGKMREIVDRQLEKAGIRLAFVLNRIFQ